jgi:CHRD domain
MERSRRLPLIAAAVVAIAAGAVGVAQAVGGDSEEQATGPAADRAKRAAVEAAGGGRVTGIERETRPGEAWEVELRRSDGRETEVKLDANFKRSSVDLDDERGEDRTGRRADQGDRRDRVLFARLKGRKELGPNGRKGAGDPDGRGGFTAVIDGDQVCFGLTVDNIRAPTAAHIHRGTRSQNGSIVVALTAPSSGDPGTASGCVRPDPGGLLEEILTHPKRFYANVHTGDFQNGAIRGQLKLGDS